jgi:hypothetical protein
LTTNRILQGFKLGSHHLSPGRTSARSVWSARSNGINAHICTTVWQICQNGLKWAPLFTLNIQLSAHMSKQKTLRACNCTCRTNGNVHICAHVRLYWSTSEQLRASNDV